MSASQETGTNFSQFELPRDPIALNRKKEAILVEIQQKFPQLEETDILRTYSTAKAENDKRIITSLVVQLKQGIEVTLANGKAVTVYNLRWHYKEGVGIGDDEIINNVFSPYSGVYAPSTAYDLATDRSVAVNQGGLLRPNEKFSLVQQFLSMLSQDNPAWAGYCNNFWQLLKAV